MNKYDDNEVYLIEGHVLNRILAIASRINMDNAFAIDERRDLAQEMQAKLDGAEGPVDLERLMEVDSNRTFRQDVIDQEEDVDDFDIDARPEEGCGFCGGPLEHLGDLGAVAHYRCRNCGAGAAGTVTEREGVES